jgi:hypothetical protein
MRQTYGFSHRSSAKLTLKGKLAALSLGPFRLNEVYDTKITLEIKAML